MRKIRTIRVKITPNHLLLKDDTVNKGVEFKRRNSDIRTFIIECSKKIDRYRRKEESANEAIYKFLQNAYVTSLNVHRYPKELTEFAKFRGARFNKRTDIFAFVLKLAMGEEADGRRVSEYAIVLRYLYFRKVSGDQVIKKLQAWGGLTGCRNKMRKRKRKSSPISQKMLWKRVKSDGSVANFKSESGNSGKGKLKTGRYILVAGKRKDGELRIYKSISIDDDRGDKILRSLVE